MNNKGFSLVELIIVIAIMVVLVALLAPQFLKFVEKSKKSTDMQNVDAIVTAVEVYAIDPDKKKLNGTDDGDEIVTNDTVTISADGVTLSGGAGLTDAFNAAGMTDLTKIKLKSKKWGTGGTSANIEIKFTVDGQGNISHIVTPPAAAGEEAGSGAAGGGGEAGGGEAGGGEV